MIAEKFENCPKNNYSEALRQHSWLLFLTTTQASKSNFQPANIEWHQL